MRDTDLYDRWFAPRKRLRYRFNLNELVALTAAEVGTTPDALRGPSRPRGLVDARHCFLWAVRRARPELTFQELADAIGRECHTTALHGVRRIDDAFDVGCVPRITLAEYLLELAREPESREVVVRGVPSRINEMAA